MSQNRPAEDRPGVVAGLCEEGGAKGAAVAAVVTETQSVNSFGPIKPAGKRSDFPAN